MKVYVIETGEYSDRGIYAVLTDKQKAEELLDFAKATEWNHAADMTVYETDDYDKRISPEITSIMYTVWFDVHGNVTQIEKTYNICKKEGICNSYNEIWVDVYADNEESAVKIAAERRAKYLAEKEEL